jgi:hypothetical protein
MPAYGTGSKYLGRTEKETEWLRFHAPQPPRNSHCAPTRHSAPQFPLRPYTYTVWSEWFNTQVTPSWQYAESMPRVFGIGLAPLAQWLAIPVLLALIFRKPRS